MTGNITFVSAGAGSGKTYRLNQILYERLADGRINPNGVIATTFTRKAAAELRERVRSYLLKQGRLDLANAIGGSLIGTVNGVCGELLSRFAFEAGLSPELRVLEDAEADILISQEIDAALSEEVLKELTDIAYRFGQDDWRQDVSSLVKAARSNNISAGELPAFAKKNAKELLANFPSPVVTGLTESTLRAIDATLPRLRKAAESSTVKKTHAYLEGIENFRRSLEKQTFRWGQWVGMAALEPEKGLVSLVRPVQDLIGEYGRHEKLHRDLPRYVTLCFELAAQILEGYSKRKRTLGAIDFADQELLLLKALDHPDISRVFADELQLLLVDEFQDTSPIQLALFTKLSALAKETFWVGDIKQAIYGFRGSDTALMKAVLDEIPALGGKTEALDSSWRSRPALVKLCNEVFVNAFSSSLSDDQVKLKAKRKELSKYSAFELWNVDGTYERQLSAIARQIGTLVASGYQIVDKTSGVLRPANFGDVAVLCRSHTRVSSVTMALGAASIPTDTAQAGLLVRPESVMALACLQRLVDASSTLSTAEILALADSQKPEQWLAHRLEFLAANPDRSREWQEREEDGHPLIKGIAALRSELPLLTPREALERVVTACDLTKRVVSWSVTALEARQRLANLDALLGLATKYEDSCRSTGSPGSVTGLILWLENQIGDKADAQPEIGADAVHVLTHHASKGLEWPIVILFDLDSSIRDRLWGVSTISAGAVDALNPLYNRFIRFWPWPFGDRSKVGAIEKIEQSKVAKDSAATAIEEERRLLYVSMTRARDLLVFAGKKLDTVKDKWITVLNAPWLVIDQDANDVPVLPAEMKIPSRVLKLSEPESSPQGKQGRSADLFWFEESEKANTTTSLFMNPSSAEPIDFDVVSTHTFLHRLDIKKGADRRLVGSAFHAYMASMFSNRKAFGSDEAAACLKRFGIADWVQAGNLHSVASELYDWINVTWPGARANPEVPIRITLDEHIWRGQIDLLIEIEDGIIIFDHKTFNVSLDIKSDQSMRGAAGQLFRYQSLLSIGHEGKPVTTAVYLPANAELKIIKAYVE